jgi:protease IV
MKFMAGAWRVLVGLKDALALLFLFLFFALLYALLSAGPKPVTVRDGALMIELDGAISEQPAAIDPFAALTSNTAPVQEIAQRDVIRALDLAVTDSRVKAVVIDMQRFLGGGQASLSAIGDRIDRVKKAGKPVYSYATAYTNDSYQLAAHATQIWMDPLGGAIIAGPGGSQLYYKDLLDRVGVTAHIYRVGTYKSAVEPFMLSAQSPASKEAIKAVYDEIWGQWRGEVMKARPQAQLDAVLNDPAGSVEGVKGNLATLAINTRMVDKLADRIAFGKFIASKYGKGREEKTGEFASIPMDALLAAHGANSNGDAIGVVTVAGTIVDGKAGPGSAAGDTVSKLIYDALDKKDLKALVIRVDSPGGSVLASEKIRLAIAEAKTRKLPVVVSMANLAASGGYWISTPADAIFAEPDTITGSIGIFGVIPSGEKALAKIGVNADGVKTTALSGEPDIVGGLSPDFNRLAQSAIENGYNDFLTRVATSRKKTVEQVDAIAQGRVWAGGTARQIGLVDQFGGIDDALAEAAKRAGLKAGDWHPVYIDPQPDFASLLLKGFAPKRSQAAASMDIFAMAAWHQQVQWNRISADLAMLGGVTGAQALCLECGAMAGVPVMQAEAGEGGWLGAVMRYWR